ncbi:glutathione ABC transporter permease GsiC [Heyndrickxia sporothermodurans]|uniref:glutathione ABC transporter permease GsiC n=1 Tax=Heyndrickxia TaxID=2837504 RepID=UPI000D38FD8A|nr:glutathione ABC transporter permease GsiC [Heyndrickxia sporothermodurans]MBL5768592.1 glutathione ABC transporter permease GsiC [Heyndrickxia sporothermodurans]MBL5772267.1 glutathione ABC transporter permease GsiC [Heyndrickxia sporothermodurans]MBL5779362.1 glutathione ABC transporter permease GsiC [Heyndrickxia sporothermodurans]MBL5782103.1 glutathione ABC transporter permease GsiC [Heyndrickxia sporothermodurans]MBL5786460.1 glutathione ABC transporter permease GsiC [Heyndrickxia spor
MVRYLIKRLLTVIPILFLVSIFIFLFVHLIPGDPARLVAGPDASLSDIELIRKDLGLDKSWLEQYINFITNIFHGDLGSSLKTKQPVLHEIGIRFMPTFWLTLWSMVWAVIIGIIIGIISAKKRNKWPDYVGMFGAVSGISLPSFWLGLILIQFFSVKLGWLPTGGLKSWESYILPSLTLGTSVAAVIARFSRSSIMDVLKEDYIRTGRAKGLTEGKVIISHALKNALIPVVTMTGLQFGFLLGGSVVIETVFSWPGLGRLLIDSVSFRDYPVIQAEMLLFSLEFILINLVVDILYGFLNPQIRY